MSVRSQKEALSEAIEVIGSGLRREECLLSVCRRLVQLRWRLPNPHCDAMLTVVAVESELGDIPAPANYSSWNSQALALKLAEKDEYLDRVEVPLDAALRNLYSQLRNS